MKDTVLVVEDEKDIADLMALHLKREGHEVQVVENGEEALQLLQKSSYKLLVLDWMLPGLSGLELCKKLKANGKLGQMPILMVTARAQSTDIVLGLEVGADDYLTKPFDIPVFVARVRALLRRGERGESDGDTICIGDLEINIPKHEVRSGDKTLSLTPSEFKLLVALLKSRGRVLTRERLIDLIQGEGVNVIDRTVDTHIFGLRKKLMEHSDVIETIRGVGYRVKS